MDASERRKAENEMTDKEREVYVSIKTENEYLKVVLKLAIAHQYPERLGKMLYNLQIGNKRDYNKDLRGFIKGDGALKTTHKEAFYELIDENNRLYKEIQQVICEKLNYTESEIKEAKKEKDENPDMGIEDPRGIESDEDLSKEKVIASLLGRKANQSDSKNSYEDFKVKQVKLSLKASLTSIKSSLGVIEENLKHIDISTMQPDSEDAKALASLVRRTKKTSNEWIEYLITEKTNKKFILHEDNLLNLFNETIEPAKRTWEVASIMEKEMQDAGLINEEEQEQDESQNVSFNARNYWSENVLRSAEIDTEVEPEDLDSTYAGNVVYQEDKSAFLKYKYFDNVIRSEKDIERARKGLGVDFRVSKRELFITRNILRRGLNVYYKIPEDLRDIIEKATRSLGIRGNSALTAIFSFVMGRASKDPEIIFAPGGGSSRRRHREFTREMGEGVGDPHEGHPHEDPHHEEEQERDEEERNGDEVDL